MTADIVDSPLSRLRDLVISSEAKTRSSALLEQLKSLAVGLQAAEANVQKASLAQRNRSRDIERGLQDVAADEKSLDELVKRAVRLRDVERAESEKLIISARLDISARRSLLESEKKELAEALAAAKVEAKSRLTQYDALIQEFEALRIEPGAEGARLRAAADNIRGLSLKHQILNVSEDIRRSEIAFGSLTAPEQKAQLKIWLGTVRRCQEACGESDSDADDADVRILDSAFYSLKRLSQDYRPGQIPEFARGTSPSQGDWATYIEDARDELARASDFAAKTSRRPAAVVSPRIIDPAPFIAEIQRVVIDEISDDDRFSRLFREAVYGALLALGAANAELLEVIAPFRDVIDGDARLTSLVRRLDEIAVQGSPKVPENVLAWTRGKSGIIIGGQPKEAARAALEDAFKFGSFEWIGSSGSPKSSLVDRCRQGSLDFVLLLTSFVSHPVSDAVVSACKGTRTKLVVVRRGYGVSQITTAFQDVI